MSLKSLLTTGDFLPLHTAGPGSDLQNFRLIKHIFPTGLRALGGSGPEGSDGIKYEKNGEKEQREITSSGGGGELLTRQQIARAERHRIPIPR